jgi:hypothetical protein
MIELGQPFQCLFCPQRKKLALMLKILLAFSTAAILGLILFPSRSQPVAARQDPGDKGASQLNETTHPDKSRDPGEISEAKVDLLLGKSPEFQGEGQKRFQEVQAQLKAILNSKPINLIEARKLLRSRQREVLLAKIVKIGDESHVGKSGGAAERKLLMQSMDKELEILTNQLELLDRAGAAN